MAEKPSTSGKVLRVVAIVLFGLCSAVMLLGGIGTVCAAWSPQNFDSMAVLARMQWLYQVASVTTTLLGIFGIYVTVALARGVRWAYSGALGMLIAGLIIAGAQMIASEVLRGKSMPNSMRVYITILTLAVFLLLRLPGIWSRIGGFTRQDGSGAAGTAAGAAMSVIGLTMLTVHIWAASTHIFSGFNYADIWHFPLTIGGGAIMLAGLTLVALSALDVRLPVEKKLVGSSEVQ